MLRQELTTPIAGQDKGKEVMSDFNQIIDLVPESFNIKEGICSKERSIKAHDRRCMLIPQAGKKLRLAVLGRFRRHGPLILAVLNHLITSKYTQ